MSGEKIYKVIPLIMGAIGAICKDQENKQQHFKYRGIDDVYNKLNALMAKHNLFTVPEVLDRYREERPSRGGGVLAFTILRMKYTFYAEDGSSVYAIVEGEAMDSGDKSCNKAMAVAHKYALIQVFMAPTEEQKDPDAEIHEPAAQTSTKKEPKKPTPRKPTPAKKAPAKKGEAEKEVALDVGPRSFAALMNELCAIQTEEEMTQWAKANKGHIGALDEGPQGDLRGIFTEHRDELRAQGE